MFDAICPNKYFLIIGAVGLFVGIILIIASDYYMFILPSLVALSLITIFFDKIKKDIHLVVWSIAFFAPFLGSQRGVEEVVSQQIDPIRVLRVGLLISLTSLLVLRMFMYKFKEVKDSLKGPLGWYFVYALIAMISYTYSAQPLVSLWKGFEVLAMIIIAMFIYDKLDNYEKIKRFWNLNITYIVLLVVSAYLGAIISPSEAFTEVRDMNFKQLSGVYPTINSNSLTQMAAIVITIYFVRYLFSAKNFVNFFLIVLATPVLFVSYGRTSIISLFITLVILFSISRNYGYLLIIIIGSIILLWIDGYSYIKLFFEKGDSLYTMSGRTYNWQTAWDLFKESPIFGYGFYTAVRVIFSEQMKTEIFSTTDNTYFDVLLSVGIVGFIPFVLMLYTFGRNFFKIYVKFLGNELNRLRTEILCVSIIVIFRSFTGPSIQILHWNLILFIAITICVTKLLNITNLRYLDK